MGTDCAAFGIVIFAKREYHGDGQWVKHSFGRRRSTTRTRYLRDTSVPSIGKFSLPLVCGVPPTDSGVDYLILAFPMTIGSIFCFSICPARTFIFDTPTGGIDLTCGAAASSSYESTPTPTFCRQLLLAKPFPSTPHTYSHSATIALTPHGRRGRVCS